MPTNYQIKTSESVSMILCGVNKSEMALILTDCGPVDFQALEFLLWDYTEEEWVSIACSESLNYVFGEGTIIIITNLFSYHN